MKRFAIALAVLLPLAGCAAPYGYSPGAWANYDGDYDYGYDGYDRAAGHAGCGQTCGGAYYGSQPYSYGGYYSQTYYPPQVYGPPAAYSPNAYSTYYSGCGCRY